MRRSPLFIDMLHSNNAARVRLWLAHKQLPPNTIRTKMVTYADLKTPAYEKLNPLRKVPALVDPNLFESNVILSFLEDKYKGEGQVASFEPQTPEKRAQMHLLIRMHDLYISSPNCTQPGFAHTQGAMYLAPFETEHCPAERAMDRATRAAKLKEIWLQLSWLEDQLCDKSEFLVSNESMTLADFTWFPTCVFMEFMLPRVFKWPSALLNPTAVDAPSPLPKLADWYFRAAQAEPFALVRNQIWGFWEDKEAAGQFDPIIEETRDSSYKWQYP